MHVLFAYVPVLHRGYEEFFAKYAGSDLYVLSREELLVFEELEYLKKDIRVLSVDKAVPAIKSWNIFNTVKSIKISEIDEILWLIGNDIMKKIHGRYWNEGPGGSLDCRLWGSTIITKGVILTEEYEDSGMYLEINLDDF